MNLNFQEEDDTITSLSSDMSLNVFIYVLFFCYRISNVSLYCFKTEPSVCLVVLFVFCSISACMITFLNRPGPLCVCVYVA